VEQAGKHTLEPFDEALEALLRPWCQRILASLAGCACVQLSGAGLQYGTPVSSLVGSERRASDHLQIVVMINPTVTSMAARQSGFQQRRPRWGREQKRRKSRRRRSRNKEKTHPSFPASASKITSNLGQRSAPCIISNSGCKQPTHHVLTDHCERSVPGD
jgi:hypothetical protein